MHNVLKYWGNFIFAGGYDKEDKAARSYDLAALKYWGPTATTNFPVMTAFCNLVSQRHLFWSSDEVRCSLTRRILLRADLQLHQRIRGDEACNQARIHSLA